MMLLHQFVILWLISRIRSVSARSALPILLASVMIALQVAHELRIVKHLPILVAPFSDPDR